MNNESKLIPCMIFSITMLVKSPLTVNKRPPFLFNMQMSNVCELNVDNVMRGQMLGNLLKLIPQAQFSYKHLLKLMTPEVPNRSGHMPTFTEQM